MSRPLAIGLGLVLLLLVGGRVALPGLLQSQAIQAAQDQGLDLSLGDVSLSLLAGRMEVSDIAVATVDQSEWLRIGRAAADLEWWPLASGTVRLASFELDRGTVSLIHRDGALAIPWSPPAAEAGEPAPTDEAPWAFELERLVLDEATVSVAPNSEGHTGSLSIDRAEVSDLVFSEGQLTTRLIEISSPELEGDLGAFAPQPPTAVAEAPTDPTEAGLAIALNRIDLNDSNFRIRLDDERTLDASLSLRTREFSTETGTRFTVEADIGIAGGDVSLVGDIGIAPLGFALEIQADDLSLATLAGLGAPAVAEWLREGSLGLTAQVSSADGQAILASGALSVASIDFRAPSGKSLAVSLPALDIALTEVRTGPKPGAELGPVVLRDANIEVLSPDPALDALLASLAGGESTESQPVPDEGPGFPVSVAGLAIEGGKLALHIAGEPGEMPFDLAFDELTAKSGAAGVPLRIDGLELTSLVNGTTPFHLNGGIEGERGDFTANIDGLALPPFNPLVGRVGYEIGGGEAGLKTKVALRGERTTLSNSIDLSDLSLESDGAFQEAFGLPVSAAIALMEDVSGTIHLDVPISIDASGSGIDLGPILLTAVRQAVLGALTSPLKLVGATLDMATGGSKGGGFGNQGLEMQAGQATLSAAGEDQLTSLGRLLEERPGLSVTLTGRVDPSEAASAAPDLGGQRVQLVQARLLDDVPAAEGRIHTAEAPVPTPSSVDAAVPPLPTTTTIGVNIQLGVVAMDPQPEEPTAGQTATVPADAQQ